MVTAVDTSVLLDVLLNDPWHSGPSIAFLTGFGVLAKGFEQFQKAQLKKPADD
jgi:hypothetical protein